MTEREKMISGLVYNSRDPELIALYWKARETLHEFNSSGAQRSRMDILAPLILGLSSDVWIEAPFHCEYGVNLRIGRGTYIGVDCVVQDCGQVSIGECALLGPGVRICTASHPMKSSERLVVDAADGTPRYLTTANAVTIGHRVWIGASVTILGGVTIGNHAVIGAGSVVTRSVPAGTVAYGVPCRVVRKIEEVPS